MPTNPLSLSLRPAPDECQRLAMILLLLAVGILFCAYVLPEISGPDFPNEVEVGR